MFGSYYVGQMPSLREQELNWANAGVLAEQQGHLTDAITDWEAAAQVAAQISNDQGPSPDYAILESGAVATDWGKLSALDRAGVYQGIAEHLKIVLAHQPLGTGVSLSAIGQPLGQRQQNTIANLASSVASLGMATAVATALFGAVAVFAVLKLTKVI
jgi:hypothetical protein